MHDSGWIWVAVVLVIVAFNAMRAALRMARANPRDGMARLNAAAERILKQRGVSVANPIPRTTPAKKTPGAPATPKERRHPALPTATSTPAVIRRGGLLAGSKEPVIQRRR